MERPFFTLENFRVDRNFLKTKFVIPTIARAIAKGSKGFDERRQRICSFYVRRPIVIWRRLPTVHNIASCPSKAIVSPIEWTLDLIVNGCEAGYLTFYVSTSSPLRPISREHLIVCLPSCPIQPKQRPFCRVGRDLLTLLDQRQPGTEGPRTKTFVFSVNL